MLDLALIHLVNKKKIFEAFCPSRMAGYWISKLYLEYEKFSESSLDSTLFQNLNLLMKTQFRR